MEKVEKGKETETVTKYKGTVSFAHKRKLHLWTHRGDGSIYNPIVTQTRPQSSIG